MTESQESKGVPPMFKDEQVLEWMEEHLTELRHSVSGQHFLYWSLVISFMVGLAAHVGGYVLLSAIPGGFIGLLADLLHALGWSLWTGAVMTVFVQVIPEVKRRQIKQTIKAYEALWREKVEAGGNHDSAVSEKPLDRPAVREQAKKPHRNRARKDG